MSGLSIVIIQLVVNYIGITGDNYAPGSIGVTSSGAVINTVRNTPGAIGYVDEPSLSGLPSAVDSPILGPTYVLLRAEYPNAETAQRLLAHRMSIKITRRFFVMAVVSFTAPAVFASCTAPQNNGTASNPTATTAANVTTGKKEKIKIGVAQI